MALMVIKRGSNVASMAQLTHERNSFGQVIHERQFFRSQRPLSRLSLPISERVNRVKPEYLSAADQSREGV
jgi:hypothetical protein